MKIIACLLTILLTFARASASSDPDPKIPGSYSHLLQYRFAFQPATNTEEAKFIASLTNTSGSELRIMVNDKAFHSVLLVKPPKGEEFKVFDSKYRTMRLTGGVIPEPTIGLASGKSVAWNVPLSTLLTLHGKPVTYDTLEGCSVISEMVMAIIPTNRRFISNNAQQKSKAITIANKNRKP